MIEIRLPQHGMGMQEGMVLEWFKAPGDRVQAGEAIAEIEAAKTTFELVAPQAGVLKEIVTAAEALVPVHALLAVLLPDEAAAPPASGGDQAAAVGHAAGAAAMRADHARAAVGARAAVPPAARGAAGAVKNVVPRARKLAGELGVDLGGVQGSGPGGRITEQDVREAARRAPGEPPGRGAETIRLSGMRGTIARRMHESLQTTAQLTLTRTADVTAFADQRARLSREQRPGYTAAVVWAVAQALGRHPGINAMIDGEVIRRLPGIHIGVATALAEGLVVPVIRDAGGKTLEAIHAEVVRLVGRVRAGQADADELGGSTFTVSSLGAQGIDAFTPILNAPEAAILGVGRVNEVAVRRSDDGVAWRKVITLSLTIDHRIIDGAPGAEFLQTVAGLLADPRLGHIVS